MAPDTVRGDQPRRDGVIFVADAFLLAVDVLLVDALAVDFFLL